MNGKKAVSPRVTISLGFHTAAGKPHQSGKGWAGHTSAAGSGEQQRARDTGKVQQILAAITLSVPMKSCGKRCLRHLVTTDP